MTNQDSAKKHGFSHLDAHGGAQMVDVSSKDVTRRVAEASCRVLLPDDVVASLSQLPKGDAFTISKLAGVQAAKRTDEWIPLAHPLLLDQVEVDVIPSEGGVVIRSRIVTNGRTGAEMEALVACSAASLALYDMVKARVKDAVVTDLQLDRKSGGRSGDYERVELETPGARTE